MHEGKLEVEHISGTEVHFKWKFPLYPIYNKVLFHLNNLSDSRDTFQTLNRAKPGASCASWTLTSGQIYQATVYTLREEDTVDQKVGKAVSPIFTTGIQPYFQRQLSQIQSHFDDDRRINRFSEARRRPTSFAQATPSATAISPFMHTSQAQVTTPEGKLEVEHISRTEVKFKWEFPANLMYEKVLFHLNNLSDSRETFQTLNRAQSGATWILTSGQEFLATIYALWEAQEVEKAVSIRFKTVYSKTELELLKSKAAYFLGGSGFQPCHYLYRDKPKEYFAYIFLYREGLMQAYLKDNHGDPANPINGQLHGLFFNASMETRTGKPPQASLFGNKRVCIAPFKLLNLNTNLYFSDFYCVNVNRKPHYVQLVLTIRGTSADIFCQKHLVELNIYDNPFLFLQYPMNLESAAYVCKKNDFWVELFYAGDIDLSQLEIGLLQNVAIRPRCRGYSKPGGQASKNPGCHTCNI